MSIIDKLVDKAADLAGGLIGQAVDAAPDLLGAGGSAPVAAASATSPAQLNGNLKPHSTELADGTIVLEPGNTPDALTAEAALNSGKTMPGEKPLSDKWWKKVTPEGPSDFMSQNDPMDQSGRFSFTNFGEIMQAFFEKLFPKGEHGARMASHSPFKNLKLEDGSPAIIPKDIEPLDPKTGKTPEPELAINPLAPNPMQPLAMGMNNPTPGMKFA